MAKFVQENLNLSKEFLYKDDPYKVEVNRELFNPEDDYDDLYNSG